MKNIKYIVTNEIYYEAKDLLPKPIKNYIPEWYKKLPMSKTIGSAESHLIVYFDNMLLFPIEI